MWNDIFLQVWGQLQEGLVASLVELFSALFDSFLPGA